MPHIYQSPFQMTEEITHLIVEMGEYVCMLSVLPALVKSCFFHFSDGNGRTCRLGQSLFLRNWKNIFMWLPVETLVHQHQQDYYHAIHLSNRAGNATHFVTFMLTMICNALKDLQHEQAISNDVVRNGDDVVRNGDDVITNEAKVLSI